MLNEVEYVADFEYKVIRWNPQSDEGPQRKERPQALHLIAHVQRGEEDSEELRMETGFVFDGDPSEVAVDDVDIIVARKHGTRATEIADLLMQGYFDPSDDYSADSYETQRDAWRTNAYTRAIAALEGDSAAYIEELRMAAGALIYTALPTDEVTVRVASGKLDVTVVPTAETNGDGNDSAEAAAPTDETHSVNPEERVAERAWLEEELEFARAMHELVKQAPKTPKRPDKKTQERRKKAVKNRWDLLFTNLRNRTNPKYGGTPDWMGRTRTRAEHALEYLR